MVARIVVVALAAFLFTPVAAMAAPACLSEAGDGMALDAARLQLESSCPCGDFVAQGSKSSRGDYVNCAKGVVASAIDAGDLRKPCKKLALYGALKSTCGYPASPARKACLRPTSKGFTCKVSTCLKENDLACPQHDCLAAADTNGDGKIEATDSGQCQPLRDCAAEDSHASLLKDTYINQCFVTCLSLGDDLLSDCLIGCGLSNTPLAHVQELSYASCQSDPARSCLQTYAAKLKICSELASPPPACQSCSNDPVCLTSCSAASDCRRFVDDLYAFCLGGE